MKNRNTSMGTESGSQKRLVRFGVSITEDVLRAFDQLVAQKGYPDRSDALEKLIRNSLLEAEWEKGEKELVGAILLVYDHHVREITSNLTDVQHEHHKLIVSTLHLHLDESTCLEVLLVRGNSQEIREVYQKLSSTKGVLDSKISMAAVDSLIAKPRQAQTTTKEE